MYNQTLEVLEQAAESTATGLSVSKEFVADVYAGMTIENANNGVTNVITVAQGTANNAITNAQEAIVEAQDMIMDALNATTTAIQATGQALVYAILGAKENLHELAENFSSQQLAHNGTITVGLALNATVHGAEMAASEYGVFAALDNIVQSLVQFPAKINAYLGLTSEQRPKRTLNKDVSDEQFSELLKQELEVWADFNEEFERTLKDLKDESDI